MKVKYFEDTDTLYIEFRADTIAQTRDLDENTLIELDASGRIVRADCGVANVALRERLER